MVYRYFFLAALLCGHFLLFSMCRDFQRESRQNVVSDQGLKLAENAVKLMPGPASLREIVLLKLLKLYQESKNTPGVHGAFRLQELADRLRKHFIDDNRVRLFKLLKIEFIVRLYDEEDISPIVNNGSVLKSHDRTYLFFTHNNRTCIFRLPADPDGICHWCTITGEPYSMTLDNKYLALDINKETLIFDLENRLALDTPSGFDKLNDLIEVKSTGEVIVFKNFQETKQSPGSAGSYYLSLLNGIVCFKSGALSTKSFVELRKDKADFVNASAPHFFSRIENRLSDYLNLGDGVVIPKEDTPGYWNGMRFFNEKWKSSYSSMSSDGKYAALWSNERLQVGYKIGDRILPYYQVSIALFDLTKNKKDDWCKMFTERSFEAIQRVELSPNGRYALIWIGLSYTPKNFSENKIPEKYAERIKLTNEILLMDFVTEESVCVGRGHPILSLGFSKEGTYFYIYGCVNDLKVYDLNDTLASMSFEQLLELRELDLTSQWQGRKKVFATKEMYARFLVWLKGVKDDEHHIPHRLAERFLQKPA